MLADRIGLEPHRVDRPQRRGGNAVPGERCEQQRERPADREQPGEIAQRLAAFVRRRPDHDDEAPAVRPHRPQNHSDRIAVLEWIGTVDRDRAGQRAANLGGSEQPRAAQLRRRVDDRAARVEHLREALLLVDAAADVAERPVLLCDERADVGRARAQPLVDRAVELGLEAQVDDEPDRADDDRHHARERERDLQPDRQPAQDRVVPAASVRKR